MKALNIKGYTVKDDLTHAPLKSSLWQLFGPGFAQNRMISLFGLAFFLCLDILLPFWFSETAHAQPLPAEVEAGDALLRQLEPSHPPSSIWN